MVAPSPELLARICSRVIVMDAGRIVRDGPTGQVFDDPAVTDLGIQPTPEVRLRRAAAAAGLGDALTSLMTASQGASR